MGDLQDALDRMDSVVAVLEDADQRVGRDLGLIVDAARRVANLDIEAGTKRYIEKWTEIKPRTNTREGFEAGLAVALGVTEDTDG